MQLGVIGLGRMGGNMVKRLREDGHDVVGFDLSPESSRDVDSVEALVGRLASPRVVWVMVPAGKPTDETIDALRRLLDGGDLVIDGGNSHYVDDSVHAEQLSAKGVHFMDVGVSGGVWGGGRNAVMPDGGRVQR
ncbi:NAD(P)-binding domain-containing protein [Bifidobacterium minimum]|uniref:NAD(P)-binding domain-containing protein n=1 Tax=Bifidobacterium minimum TaxID=1693 RepID=UPI001EE76EFA|nr:NAD(P)-binding domain-containing protein [Bifidobacterium minimum]